MKRYHNLLRVFVKNLCPDFFVLFGAEIRRFRLRQRSKLTGSKGSVIVTSPMPFVRPSRNRILDPVRMNSGFRMKRNSTTALSLLFIPAQGMIFSITAVWIDGIKTYLRRR